MDHLLRKRDLNPIHIKTLFDLAGQIGSSDVILPPKNTADRLLFLMDLEQLFNFSSGFYGYS